MAYSALPLDLHLLQSSVHWVMQSVRLKQCLMQLALSRSHLRWHAHPQRGLAVASDVMVCEAAKKTTNPSPRNTARIGSPPLLWNHMLQPKPNQATPNFKLG